MTSDQKIEERLKRATRFRRLVHLVSCSSTQDEALADAITNRPPAEDAVFWADHQQSGRGRQQREWHDEPGDDLLVTFRVHQPLPKPSALPAALPAALVRALEPHAGRALRIKWPNDVFLEDRKLAGMLIDSGVAGSDTYLIGIGVNCNRVRFPPDLETVATSLALSTGHEIDRGALLLGVAECLDQALHQIVDGDHDELLALFRDRLGLLGSEVEIVAGTTHRGRLTGIDFANLELDGARSMPLGFVRGIRARRG